MAQEPKFDGDIYILERTMYITETEAEEASSLPPLLPLSLGGERLKKRTNTAFVLVSSSPGLASGDAAVMNWSHPPNWLHRFVTLSLVFLSTPYSL